MQFTRGMGKLSYGLVVILSMLMIVVGGMVFTIQAGDTKQVAAGKTLFDETNCLMCHLLKGEGGGLEGAPDLAGVSTRRDQANIRDWLKKHLFEEPRIDMFEKPPTDGDIENLVQYLSTL